MTEDLKQKIRADIAQALGKTQCPAFLSEQELAIAGIRSISSLQRDRGIGKGMRFVKAGHLIKYPAYEVINFVANHLHTHTAAIGMHNLRQEVVKKNLVQAQATRRRMQRLEGTDHE